ncbi:MAG: Slp family lipoprotein [Gammaproteobacteria bacterium]|jgi:outer membrane lipoprotein
MRQPRQIPLPGPLGRLGGLLLFTVLLLGGCASAPELQPPGPYVDLTPQQAMAARTTGQTVRWGGTIIQTKPEQGQTCFTMLALPLDSTARPVLERERAQGRFIACSKGFYDPALYKAGREVTFAGHLQGLRREKIGNYEYPYPLLQAGPPHLWPEPRPETYRDPCWTDPWCNPWSPWYPYWPYYGPYGPPYYHDHDRH